MTDAAAAEDFPAFLYRDEAVDPSGEIEACDQIRVCAGVAWSALKLFFVALYALGRVCVCRGVLCAARRLDGVTRDHMAVFTINLAGGFALGLVAIC